ncbi:cation:proton antiporter [Sandaracinus amylolyticus]|uniref:cation:proton antiporter n=1 Tax=Sandaracinus amylolyticus TaxID=927083 RepID=UPI001F232573|nr:cation:proton antiporter [Sandaracinus amylolyticus]UJR78186.1 Potassium/proton antiporter [Sandaracinus amylolyticus]
MSIELTAAVAIVGALLVLVALGAAALRDRPVTVAIFYLGLGVALGPLGLRAMAPRIDDPWLLRLTEVAVLASLFASGLKVRAPWRAPGLRAAVMLAGPGLVVTAAVVAIGAHLALGLAWDEALLLGAVMAPTDPVLASEVALRSPRDENALRAALTVEAGLNDGTAFPLVALGVLAVTSAAPIDATTLSTWALERVVWAVPAGLVIGTAIGWTIGRVAFVARARAGRTEGIDELLAIGVVALSYVAAETMRGWGFLAVFATGVALRRAEMRVVARAGLPGEHVTPRLELDEGAPADALMQPAVSDEARRHPTVAAATVLHDTSRLAGTLERVGEIAVVVCAGAMLARSFDPAGFVLSTVLFLVARPIGALVTLAPSPFDAREKAIAGWLGIRGAGTLYYVAWAASEGALEGPAARLADLAITCVATSIVLHGVTATPLVRWIDRERASQPARRRDAVTT